MNTPGTATVLRLFYSREQEALYARLNRSSIGIEKSFVWIYRTSGGSVVEVTEAKSSQEPSAFSDAVFLGETIAPGNYLGSREPVEAPR